MVAVTISSRSKMKLSSRSFHFTPRIFRLSQFMVSSAINDRSMGSFVLHFRKLKFADSNRVFNLACSFVAAMALSSPPAKSSTKRESRVFVTKSSSSANFSVCFFNVPFSTNGELLRPNGTRVNRYLTIDGVFAVMSSNHRNLR